MMSVTPLDCATLTASFLDSLIELAHNFWVHLCQLLPLSGFWRRCVTSRRKYQSVAKIQVTFSIPLDSNLPLHFKVHEVHEQLGRTPAAGGARARDVQRAAGGDEEEEGREAGCC